MKSQQHNIFTGETSEIEIAEDELPIPELPQIPTTEPTE